MEVFLFKIVLLDLQIIIGFVVTGNLLYIVSCFFFIVVKLSIALNLQFLLKQFLGVVIGSME